MQNSCVYFSYLVDMWKVLPRGRFQPGACQNPVQVWYRLAASLPCSQRPQHCARAGHTVSTMGTRARRRMPPRWLMLLLHLPALQSALSFCARYATRV